MVKIIGSKFDIYDKNDTKAVTYLDCVDGILNSSEVTMLGNFKHHHFTTRLQHSLNVSYYSYCMCRRFGWDYRSAARAGLMHDLYFFENTSIDENGNKLLKNHPFDALRNSESIFDLNDIEKDAIVNHMWPCTSLGRPRYRESLAVSLSDKFCAVMEATVGSCGFVAGKATKAAGSTVCGIRQARRYLKLAWNFIV